MKKALILLLAAVALISSLARAEVIDTLERSFKLDALTSTSGRAAGVHKVVGVGQKGAYEIECNLGGLFNMDYLDATLYYYPNVNLEMTVLDFTERQQLAEIYFENGQACFNFRDRILEISKSGKTLELDVKSPSDYRLSEKN